MNYSNHKSGAAELMQWLGENWPHILKSARSYSSPTDFHQYMRGVSGVTTEYFDSHGHACLAYLDAMRRMYAPVPRGVPVEDKPAERRFPGDQDFAGTTESERTRPALTWADSKPFDAFGGFFTEPADMADWQDTYYPR
jgi:hypothetical protein